MKKLWLSLLPILFLFVSASIPHSPGETTDTCSAPNNSFAAGEKIVYKIAFKWGPIWLSAGEASFTLENAKYNGADALHAIGSGETYKSYDWFFKVRDKYESYFDAKSMTPYKFIRDVNEGGYSFYQNVTFKPAENKAVSLNGTYAVPNCTQDVVSAIYYSRCINWNQYKANDTVPITIFLDDKVYSLHVRYLGKEDIEIKSGKYHCIVFKPLLIKGTIFKGGEEMKVYVTDDDNKIPVLVSSPILIGEIRCELSSTAGLRNPMKAKVN